MKPSTTSAKKSLGVLGGALALVFSTQVHPAEADEYFAGKQIRIIVPSDPGGGYALYGTLAEKYLSTFIPGHPDVRVSYMPGATGLTAMNYLYNSAPKDGTTIAVMTQEVPYDQVLGAQGARFDATRFNYIGRVSANVPVQMIWHTSEVHSMADLERAPATAGAVGAAGLQIDILRAENALLGTKWKIIPGYNGNDQTRVAMEQGEIEAAIGPATLFRSQMKSWLDEGNVRVIAQDADFRDPMFSNVPTIVELAKDPESKKVLRLLTSVATMGRGYAAPPGVAAAIVSILRTAFEAMVSDSHFRADAEKVGAEISPLSGSDLAAYVQDLVNGTPPEIAKKTSEVIARE